MKNFRIFITGFLAGAFFFGSMAYAATGISVDFLPIKFVFDGVQKALPADQSGFVYQGRTYVPLRFVSESLGKEVSWDSATTTAYIGKQPEAPVSPTPEENTSESKFVPYQIDELNCSLSVPERAVFSKVTNAMGMETYSSSTILGSEILNISLLKMDTDFSKVNIDEYMSFVQKGIQTSDDFNLISQSKVKVGMYDAIQLVFTQDLGSVTAWVEEYCIITPGGVYDITFSTLKEQSPTIRAYTNQIIQSFKVTQ